MKFRRLLLVVGILTSFGIVGYIAWQSTWVQSWFAHDSENKPEMEQLVNAQLPNDAPPEVTSGSPRWRGVAGKGVAPAGSFRVDWDKNPPKELWRVPIGGGYGSCSVVGGKLYVQDKQGGNERVVCLDAANGKTVWEYAYATAQAGKDASYAIGPRATPTIDGNSVYTNGGAGKLLALEAEGSTVKKRWEHDLISEFQVPMPQWGIACSPLVYGDLIIMNVGGKDAAVVAFDKSSGEVKWKAGSNPPSYSSPVVAPIGGQDTIFAFLGEDLLAIRPTDGMVTGNFHWPTSHGANIATPVVVGEYVFISSSYGMGCALLRAEKSGDQVRLVKVYERRGRAYQNHHATSVYKDRHLFGIDGLRGDGGLKCVVFETGNEVKDWDGSELKQATVILAGDHLIAQTDRGELCLVEANAKQFNLIAKTPKLLSGKNNWATPTLVDGRIYLRDEKNVVCLDVKPEK